MGIALNISLGVFLKDKQTASFPRAHWPVALLLLLWLGWPPGTWLVGPLWVRKEDVVRWLPLLLLLVCVPRSGYCRWNRLDWVVLAYCSCPLVSGLWNGHPWSSALWEWAKELHYWLIPYWLARQLVSAPSMAQSKETYSNGVNYHAAHGLATMLIISAVLYCPLAVTEIFSGPIFTEWFTGQRPAGQWRGAERGLTYRPSVFLNDGFVLTTFYGLATLSAVAMAWQSALMPLRQKLFLAAALACGMVVVGARSLGSVVLLAAGLSGLIGTRLVALHGTNPAVLRRMRWVLVAIAGSVPLYLGLRGAGVLDAHRVGQAAALVVSDQRAGSLSYRLQAEELVLKQMAQHAWLGFGDYHSWRSEEGGPALDGFWLFALTRTGWLCVGLWVMMVVAPLIVWAGTAVPKHQLWNVDVDSAWAIFLVLSLINGLFNYFGDVHQMLILGALGSVSKR